MLISGRPERRHRHLVETAAESDRRIKLDLRRIPSNEVQLLFSAADLVVLPFSDIMHSGSAMLALSFDRPVLVPARGSLPELQMRVGSEWVRTYDGELTPTILKDAAALGKSCDSRIAPRFVMLSTGRKLSKLPSNSIPGCVPSLYHCDRRARNRQGRTCGDVERSSTGVIVRKFSPDRASCGFHSNS